MKKVIYLAAVAAFAFFSCQKQEIDPNAKTNKSGASFTFKASIEQPATKADINSANQLVWAENDKIGIYVNDASWTDKNQPFTLVGTGGSTQGEFAWDHGEFTNPNAAAAFFPWEGTGSDKNNVYEGTMYFKLRDAYWSYSSGKMLTPLVAPLSGSTAPIKFKHAGAAVKVTINNLPARVHSIGMSVEGQQISGEYSINPANAGTDALAVVGTPDATKNTVWLNVWNGTESTWDFIFPVPEITKPKLSFQIWDENDILVWEKKLKAQASDLGRADILVMPPIDITPYQQFTESTEWTFCGTIGGVDAWSADIPMYSDGKVCILSGITFAANDKFKIRKDKDWEEAYPTSSDYVVTTAGKYDVFFNINSNPKEITLKEAKCPYPAPKVTLYFGINTPGGNGIALSSNTLAPGYSWPGMTLTDREYINGKWYYKHVVDGGTVWGKSISEVHIVGIGQWNTASSTCDFTTIKSEYYFEATSGAELEQLAKRPEDAVGNTASITIDGDMSDWADVEGVTVDNHTVKVYSDDSKVYFYSARSNENTEMWEGGGYVYFTLDLDNDSTTGSGDIYGNKAEFVGLIYPYGGTAASPAINTSPNKQCSPNTYTLDNLEINGVYSTSNGVTLEWSVPKTDLPTIPSGPITISCWGNKSLSKVTLTRKL